MRYAKHYIMGGIVGAVLLCGIALLLMRSIQPRQTDITRFIPDSAIMALHASRRAVFLDSEKVRSHPGLIGMVENGTAYWLQIEQAVGSRIDDGVWVVLSDNGQAKPIMILQLENGLSKKRRIELEHRLISVSLFGDRVVHAKMLTSRLVALSEDSYDQAFFSAQQPAIHLTAAPISFSATKDGIRFLSAIDSVRNIFPSIDSFAMKSSPIAGSFETNAGMIRIQWQADSVDMSQAASVSSMYMPDDFDILMSSATTLRAQDDPLVSQRTQSFQSAFSKTYNVPEEAISAVVSKAQQLIMKDDSLLLGMRDRASIEVFANRLAGMNTPKIATSTLPDGSVYREYKVSTSSARLESRAGSAVSVWQSAKGPFYEVTQGDQTILTNNELWLDGFLGRGQIHSVGSSQFTRLCIPQAYANAPIQEVTLLKGSPQFIISESVKNYGLYKLNFDNTTSNYVYCLN